MMDDDWNTDAALFAELKGGQALIDWFGSMPTFHDARLQRIEWRTPDITLELHAFAITERLDSRGYFDLDRHVTVQLNCLNVTGVLLAGDTAAIIDQLRVRRVQTDELEKDERVTEIRATCAGPRPLDFEIDIASSWGLAGVIFAGQVEISHAPCEPASE